MIKRYTITCLLVLFPLFSLYGQSETWIQDTLPLRHDVFKTLEKPGPYGNRITIVQQDSIAYKVNKQIEYNSKKQGKLQGYRVRIFFDNKQTARSKSESIVADFSEAFPDIAVYRIYENPYFKVTVGDFRTRSQAMQFMLRVRRTYPQAFITREQIAYPPL